MKSRLHQISPERDAGVARRLELPGREFQEFWFRLARKDWRSVVLVPADAGESAANAARSLADVGKQLHDLPVTLFIMANQLDYWPAVQIVTTAASTDDGSGAPPAASDSLDYASALTVASAASTELSSRPPPPERPPAGKVIVAVHPVVVEPLGLAVTQAADAIVICVEMGHTRLASARRTIELVGRARIAGCLIINS
jgi:hypothetical protein